MRTSRGYQQWQHVCGWLIIAAIASLAFSISLMPDSAGARIWKQAPVHLRFQSALSSSATPTPGAPALSLTPRSGPVGTIVMLQGSGWPAGDQIIISYDDIPTCDNPNLQELSPDPKPQVDSSGRFTTSFPWPAVSQAQTWYACISTSNNATADSVPFQVLALNPPSITISPSGARMPGQVITVQGQNWLPGGLFIAFELQSTGTNRSFFLPENAISLVNGTFLSVTITIPTTLPPGTYVLLASAEATALQAQSSTFSIVASPTPTPSPAPSPSPSPRVTVTPTPPNSHHATIPSSRHQLSSTLLGLVLISGSMAFLFALIGVALLIYLLRSRPAARTASDVDHAVEDEQAGAKSNKS